MMKTYTVDEVANWFLSKGSMSPKKLQKLVYYAYAWFLTLNNDNGDLSNFLFNREDNFGSNDIKAWVHGAVIPYLWHKYREHGYWEIPQSDENLDDVFDEETLDILNQVWDVYGGYNGNELESIIHKETPWKNARVGLEPFEAGSQSITDQDIYNYYSMGLESE